MLDKLKNFGSKLVFLTLLVPVVGLQVAGHSADILTTWYALTKTGAREGNPFLAWLINSEFRFKWAIVSALKGWFIAYDARRFYDSADFRWSRYYNLKAAVFHAYAVWIVVSWNVLIIMRRRKRGNSGT